MIVRQVGRIDGIHHCLQRRDIQVVGRVGTRETQQRQLVLFFKERQNGYLRLCFGYPPRGNSHTGVSLNNPASFCKKEHFTQVAHAGGKLVGRIGNLRTKQANLDIIWIVAYVPPYAPTKENQVCRELIIDIFEWLEYVLWGTLPHRTTPYNHD